MNKNQKTPNGKVKNNDNGIQKPSAKQILKKSPEKAETIATIMPPIKLASYADVKGLLECEELGEGHGLFVTSDFEAVRPAYEINKTKKGLVNRAPKPAHVNELKQSMLELDCEVVNVSWVVTSLFSKDGSLQIVSADGYHRVTSGSFLLKQSLKTKKPGFLPNGRKIVLIARIYKIETQLEYVRLVCKLNSTSKPYGNNDYLRDFAWAGLNDYKIINKFMEEISDYVGYKYPLELVIHASNERVFPHAAFKLGKFKIKTPDFQPYIYNLVEMQDVLGKKRKVSPSRVMLRVIMDKQYNHKLFMKQLKYQVIDKQQVFTFDDDHEFYSELRTILGVINHNKERSGSRKISNQRTRVAVTA